jgi:hypothetical protein
MMRIFVFTYNPYLFYVNTGINYELIIQTIPEKHFSKTLNNITVDVDDKSIINVRTIFESETGTAALRTYFYSMMSASIVKILLF